MPEVKSLHQESRCNAKASFIMGHSLQAVALLVQAAGICLAVPVAARIHEGVVWSARDRRTLLDKLSGLLLGLKWTRALTVVADAYYAAAKFARSLLSDGHHLVTRVRSNAVAYFPPSPRRRRKRRGRRRLYGDKTPLHRGSGKQYVQRKPEIYRAHVRRKLAAYERHIQLGLIAQGLLQYLALSFRRVTWFNFHSYIRTASSKKPPFGMGRLSCA